MALAQLVEVPNKGNQFSQDTNDILVSSDEENPSVGVDDSSKPAARRA